MSRNTIAALLTVSVVLVFTACSRERQPAKRFRVHEGKALGIDFINSLSLNDSVNALSFEYVYNGSGVGVGDFNNDGLQDLVFGGNQVSSRLFLNNGNLSFHDITQEANVETSRWITGVSVVDINSDGWQDIYLSVAGKTSSENRRNLLFLNQGTKDGKPVFKECAASFGLDDDSYSTMAAFFDYDKDGDLDMYLLNNWLENFNRNNLRPVRVKGEAESNDNLYRNNGDNTFTDVSQDAGITIEGYGLGVNICDINQDSWPDVYVSNDFMTNDLLWINQHDGTFKNEIASYLKHQSHNGMGVDIADFNNDALPDIFVVDMLSPSHKRQKLMTPGQNFDHFHMAVKLGYQPQFMRNTFQMNQGKMPDGRILFSDISFLTGTAQTDWSWAPLFADFDNDGLKDLFIANGYRKDVTNLDFIFFSMENQMFGSDDEKRKRIQQAVNDLDDVKISNYLFHNQGALQFENVTTSWGIDAPSFSNGAAYADLDNDGDVDLVTNNIDEPVLVYENRTRQEFSNNNFIRVVAKEKNLFNQKIFVYAEGKTQMIEYTPYRGFQSSVEPSATFGLGSVTKVDSVVVCWPDSTASTYKKVKSNAVLMYSKADAKKIIKEHETKSTAIFKPYVPCQIDHVEKDASNIKTSRTLLHELNRFGPCLASGDVNSDGLDDFFVGGEEGMASQIFLQKRDGSFTKHRDSIHMNGEAGAAAFFDADNDGDLDLYVAANSQSEEHSSHALFKNDGGGNFERATRQIPDISVQASCVVAADYDNDGDLDLFVAGRCDQRKYPFAPRSFVLRNDHGIFSDVTNELNQQLMSPGLVSAAAWADINKDGRLDLVFTGEWLPLRVFINNGSAFYEATDSLGLSKSNGWWNCIAVADVNDDGYLDVVAGNTGMNSFFRSDEKHPVSATAKDFDNNGSIDPVISYYNEVEKERFIVHNRLVLLDQLPMLKKRFDTFTKFATTPFESAFTDEELSGAKQDVAYCLSSSIFYNVKGNKFKRADLPREAQISSIEDISIEDIDNDGHVDILAIGNMYAQETLFGQYDASLGVVLMGDGRGKWKAVEPRESGFVVDGDARAMRKLTSSSGRIYVISNSNGPIQFYFRR